MESVLFAATSRKMTPKTLFTGKQTPVFRQNYRADIRETCRMEGDRTDQRPEELQIQGIEGRVCRCDGRTEQHITR